MLSRYDAERRPVAQRLIDFDREWSSLMARKPGEITDPDELATYYLATAEFPSGFGTHYAPSRIVAADAAQELASGFPVGKRFKSVEVVRVCDGNPVHLGHHARADGRWRVYAFADAAGSALAAGAAEAQAILERFPPARADLAPGFDAQATLSRAPAQPLPDRL